ncbi:MAG: MBOAT family protein [Chloroflexi bacterium]|nr:MBOAT family protein [Chloroflexota bacterium]
MGVTSLAFAGFVLGVLTLYYLLPHYRAQNLLLLAGSYIFLASWDIRFAVVFFVLTVGTFWLAQQIARLDADQSPPVNRTGHRPGQQSGRRAANRALYAGIALNVAALLYFKYTGFFVTQATNAVRHLGINADTGGLSFWLPVGLSFYVVQVIAYLLDVHKGIVQPTTNPVTFALYMVYFPRVVSGPIERARDLIPQLEGERTITNEQLNASLTLLLQGLVRKIVIADLLFLSIPDGIFDQPRDFSSPELVIWLLVYAFALYNDFAGYTTVVRGVSGLFGIRLVKNFTAPYTARSFSDFWQRWHISLSLWLRDYIFLPLTRALLRRRRMRLSMLLPPLVTMLVSAMWHNLSWSMMVWGVLHGLYQVAERWQSMRRPAARGIALGTSVWRQRLAGLLVFVLVVLAWIPFRTTLTATADYLVGLFSPVRWLDGGADAGEIINTLTVSAALLIGLSFVLDRLQPSDEQVLRERSPLVKALVINAALFAIILAAIAQQDTPPPFVYQGF